MNPKMRWFKFFPGDWALDTQGMSPLAKGLYIDMLCMQWSGRRLPAALEDLAAMMPSMTERIYRELLQHFEERDGWLVNRRLEAEKGDAEQRSSNARAGAAAKWGSNAAAMPEQCSSNAGAMREQCYSDTDTEAEAEEEEEAESEADERTNLATRKTRAKQPDPLRWDGESWEGITDKDRTDWAAAFPDVDFDKDLAKAGLWLKAKKSRAHKKNWRLFLFNWFGSTQADGGNRTARPEPNTAPRQRDRSHIPDDCAADQEHLFWDGTFPNIPSMYRDTAGNLRSTTSRKVICAAGT